MNPSKIDELARRVLTAASWPYSIHVQSQNNPTPHLDELERSVDIRLPPLLIECDDKHDNGIRTCTLPTVKTRHGCSSTSSNDMPKNENAIWSWTPSTKPNNAYNTDDKTTLEECAPFTPQFYRCFGDLIRESFHPGTVSIECDNDRLPSANNENVPSDVDVSNYAALHSLEQYSLPRMHDAVRVTRIVLALQEMHVDDEYSFLDRLLFYCEGNNASSIHTSCSGVKTTPVIETNNASALDDDVSSPKRTLTTKRAKIPIISDLFEHYTNLPQLEHGIHQLTRRYTALLPTNAADYWQFTSQYNEKTINNNATRPIGDGGSTGGEWNPSSSASSFLGARAVRIDSFRSRLENELQSHIHGGSSDSSKMNKYSDGGLVRLLSLIYTISDANLRGKVRKWMGQRLRSYALGGGSVSYSKGLWSGDALQSWGLGPSFAAFCPLISVSNVGPTKGIAVGAGPISLTQLGESSGGMHQNSLGMENTSACGIDGLLQVLLLIIRGFKPDTSTSTEQKVAARRSKILHPSHENLLFEVLIPLHRPSGMVLWRDQTPLIGLYHETLVKCIGALLIMDSALAGPVIGALIHPDIWPTEGGARTSNGAAGAMRGAAANTPKVVLLIHEVDTLIGSLKSKEEDDIKTCLSPFDAYVVPLTIKLCSCISSDNSRTSERALQLFKNSLFKQVIKHNLNEAGPHFIRALCRCSSGKASWEVPWNPTVRKMTLLVLREFEAFYKELNDDAFDAACDESFIGYPTSQPASDAVDSTGAKCPTPKRAVVGSRPDDNIPGNMTSLRTAMGSWRPPSAKDSMSSSQQGTTFRQPPSTVTGVAPWAMSSGQSRVPKMKPGHSQPPLTVTGVAPWAMKKNTQSLSSMTNAHKRPLPSKPSNRLLPPTDRKCTEVAIDEVEGESESAHDVFSYSMSKKVRAYMDKLKPPDEDDNDSDGISSWAKAQMNESPVLLPTLKFHDLVFGHNLGTGAFSTVKYARQIVKDRTRSKWPEYAVKIVSTQKIEELGYELSINREIAILRVLSHPGISRLISSFRFRDGAYLVLEYASGGDLHTLLRKNGSLDHGSTKFVIGSVAAALSSIHERGFVYADCKPENILIMESGHIKITDFGGCRPVTEDAKRLVTESSKDLIRHLRDGDWKANYEQPFNLDADDTIKSHGECEDHRIEGTTAYLPPEVVLGAVPTRKADVWALGCVMFQCLAGRPPILEDTDDLTAQRIVTFHLNSQSDDFFGEDESSVAFTDGEKSLIKQMLNRDDDLRPHITDIASDAYFEGIDIFSLHSKPSKQLDVGTVAPVSDANWSRRQFSSIWAPQPKNYNISAISLDASSVTKTQSEPIVEGNEVHTLFFSTQRAPLLAKIREY